METSEQKSSDNNKMWKNGCICLSITSIALLVTTIILAVRGPIIEYAYGPCQENKNNGSSSSSSDSTADGGSQSVVSYEPGEKVASLDGISVEIEQVIKNYQDYSYLDEPEEGYEYVQLKLKFKNNTTKSIPLYSVTFRLEDSNGLSDSALSSYVDNNKNYFPLGKDLAGLNETDGVMLFEVKKGSTDKLLFIYEVSYNHHLKIQL